VCAARCARTAARFGFRPLRFQQARADIKSAAGCGGLLGFRCQEYANGHGTSCEDQRVTGSPTTIRTV
jgi:hypothetical protein